VQSDAAFFELARPWLAALLVAGVRIQFALYVVPLFDKQLVPGMVRGAIGACLSLVLVPGVHAALGGRVPQTSLLCAILVKEAFLGFAIGYAVAVLFWAVEALGFFVDNQRGASIASTLNPLTGNDSSPLGILFNQAFIVYFLLAGGLPVLVGLLYRSCLVWPPVSFFPTLAPAGVEVYAGLFENLVRMALLLSAPVIVAMMLAELGLALVSRFTPQLQVFFLAMPIKSALALCVFAVYVPTLFDDLHSEIARLPELLELVGRGLK
jgi:type III secretion protein T